jgi:hypothetical protein
VEVWGRATATDAAANDQADVVTTIGGGRLVGTVLAMESGGRLRLKGPSFKGEVVVAADSVASVTLRPAAASAGFTEVTLAGGDRLRGSLAAVTPEAVILEGPASRLQIPRCKVRAVNLVPVADVILTSDFNSGKLEPWTGSGLEPLSFVGGKLICPGPQCGGSSLQAELDFAGAFTIEAKMTPPTTRVQEGIGFYGDGFNVSVSFNGTPGDITYYISQCGANPSCNKGTIDPKVMPQEGGVLRLAYNPEAGKATFWLESTQLCEIAAPSKIAAQKTVSVNIMGPASIEYVRVLHGVVPPGALVSAAAGLSGDGTLVEFVNSDRIQASRVALANGQATLATEYGEVRCPVGLIARMVFSRQGADKRPPDPAQAQVEGNFGRLALQFARLTADELIGRSEVLGEVKIRRDAVRDIKFSLTSPNQ